MKFKHHLDFLSIITFSFTFTVIQSDDINFTSSNEEIVEKHNNQFDFMLFAQIWPISGCLEWEKSAGGIYGKCKQSEINTYPKNEILPNRQGFDSIGESVVFL